MTIQGFCPGIMALREVCVNAGAKGLTIFAPVKSCGVAMACRLRKFQELPIFAVRFKFGLTHDNALPGSRAGLDRRAPGMPRRGRSRCYGAFHGANGHWPGGVAIRSHPWAGRSIILVNTS